MTITPELEDTIADLVLTAGDMAIRMQPVSNGRPEFDLASGYRVGALIARRREARGETVAGWKIGFTNKNIWEEYGASAPIWGPMYDSTIVAAGDGTPECEATRFAEPRIEPEIALRLSGTPDPGMDERELLSVIDGVAHGFEIVQSVFPDWKFQAPDTVAAFGLHGRLYHGAFTGVDDADRWLELLSGFEIALLKNGTEIDRGVAANVLGGPLFALKHFVAGYQDDPLGRALQAGDVITTGTVTRAFPVEPGEVWSTAVTGLPLDGLELKIV